MAENSSPHAADLHVVHRIATLRKSASLSQAEWARALGITFQQVQKYASGVNRIAAASKPPWPG